MRELSADSTISFLIYAALRRRHCVHKMSWNDVDQLMVLSLLGFAFRLSCLVHLLFLFFIVFDCSPFDLIYFILFFSLVKLSITR